MKSISDSQQFAIVAELTISRHRIAEKDSSCFSKLEACFPGLQLHSSRRLLALLWIKNMNDVEEMGALPNGIELSYKDG